MELNNPTADVYVPDGSLPEDAAQRTTHLAIGAHQDDIEIFAAHGIFACYENNENWFTSVVVTEGGGSPRSGKYQNKTDDEMKSIRREEQRKASDIGRYSLQLQTSWPSSAVKDKNLPERSQVISDIQHIIQSCRPEVIYLHNPADRHDTHVGVFSCVLEALRKLPDEYFPKCFYGCEVWQDLDWLPEEDRICLDVSGYEEMALALLQVFDSQISGGKRYDLAVMGRRLAHATFNSSNETDTSSGFTLAMDLLPLLKKPELNPVDWTAEKIERFRQETINRLKKTV